MESKWIGNTKPSVESVLWDLIRLEMIAHSEGAECVFVLGGQRDALNAFFNSDKFYGARKPHQFRPLLRIDSDDVHSFPLVPTIPHRVEMLRRLFADYQDIAFPHKIATRRSAPFPQVGGLKQYQVYAWKVSSPERREEFYPKKFQALCQICNLAPNSLSAFVQASLSQFQEARRIGNGMSASIRRFQITQPIRTETVPAQRTRRLCREGSRNGRTAVAF